MARMMTQLEVPDYDVGIRGKLVSSDKLSTSGKTAFCTIVYGLDAADGVADTPISSAANGYPDAFAIPDESTRVTLDWRPNTEAVIADMVDENGEYLEESPRSLMRRVLAGYAEIGLTPILGFEYECFILHGDDDVLRAHDYSRMRPWGRVENAYSLSRIAESADLWDEFCRRMEVVGIPVEACHSELGPGFFEYALGPMEAMRACDSAVRARQYLRDLCAERGLVCTFIAKLRIDASGAGGHVHQSLARDGVNVMSDGAGGLSAEGQHYLGGLLSTMADYTVLFNPLLNSYKRISAGFFVAERASWGWDNRNGACRVVHNAGASATRIEHRRPGADANPYLSAAAMLAGGLKGLREQIQPGPALAVGADVTVEGLPLPSTLRDAIATFRGSAVAREYLGDRFVDCYASTRDAEAAAFDTWWNSQITDWELQRYVEHL